MRRVTLAVAALSILLIAPTAGLVGLAGPAGASAPGTCTKATGNIGIVGGTVTLQGCGGGLGKGSVSLATSPATITWAGHKGTTMFILTSVGGKEVSRCAAGSTSLTSLSRSQPTQPERSRSAALVLLTSAKILPVPSVW